MEPPTSPYAVNATTGPYQNPWVLFTYSITIVLDILMSLPTNVWVLWLIVRGSEGVLASEIFTLNLAVLELAYCLQIPVGLLSHIGYRVALEKPMMFSFGLIEFGRPLFQCCICVERYLAVLHPLTFLRYRPL
ncbi:hypothetical protein AAFF_G00165520, partial [Aldrovandia affinis]